MSNAVTLIGTLKNIREFDKYGVIAVGNISQRDSDNRCLVTMPIIAKDKEVIEALRALPKNSEKATPVVQISGKLTTKFDRRPGIDNDDRNAPYTQIEITSVELV